MQKAGMGFARARVLDSRFRIGVAQATAEREGSNMKWLEHNEGPPASAHLRSMASKPPWPPTGMFVLVMSSMVGLHVGSNLVTEMLTMFRASDPVRRCCSRISSNVDKNKDTLSQDAKIERDAIAKWDGHCEIASRPIRIGRVVASIVVTHWWATTEG